MKLACIHRAETVRLTTAGEGDETGSGVLTDSMIYFSTLRSFSVMKTTPVMKTNTATVSGERLVLECCWSTTDSMKTLLNEKWAFVLERNENSCETKWAFVWFEGCMTKWIGV